MHFSDPDKLAVPFGQIVQSVFSAILWYPAGHAVQFLASPNVTPRTLTLNSFASNAVESVRDSSS